ncbi:type 4a pilus biogenesis protein PilO [Patescibacteria group bacterium]|nr:type 4a pilus biogenesis protein PilO [Patescibacteria group bacterium]
MIKNIVIIILILSFIGVVVLLDIPGVQDVLDLRKQIEQEKEKFISKQELTDKILKLINEYNDSQETINQVDNIFPDEEDIPELITQIEFLAFEGGLILENIDVSSFKNIAESKAEIVRGQEQKEEDFNIVSIKIKLIGTYSSFKNFLKLVENNIRLIDIDSVEFVSESSFFEFNLSLKAYFQK